VSGRTAEVVTRDRAVTAVCVCVCVCVCQTRVCELAATA
jgi:hypothetical protein